MLRIEHHHDVGNTSLPRPIASIAERVRSDISRAGASGFFPRHAGEKFVGEACENVVRSNAQRLQSFAGEGDLQRGFGGA